MPRQRNHAAADRRQTINRLTRLLVKTGSAELTANADVLPSDLLNAYVFALASAVVSFEGARTPLSTTVDVLDVVQRNLAGAVAALRADPQAAAAAEFNARVDRAWSGPWGHA